LIELFGEVNYVQGRQCLTPEGAPPFYVDEEVLPLVGRVVRIVKSRGWDVVLDAQGELVLSISGRASLLSDQLKSSKALKSPQILTMHEKGHEVTLQVFSVRELRTKTQVRAVRLDRMGDDTTVLSLILSEEAPRIHRLPKLTLYAKDQTGMWCGIYMVGSETLPSSDKRILRVRVDTRSANRLSAVLPSIPYTVELPLPKGSFVTLRRESDAAQSTSNSR
jgi:hypothetical protein